MHVTAFAVGTSADLSKAALTKLLTQAIPRQLWRLFLVEIVADDDEDGFNWTIQCQAKTHVPESTAEELFALIKRTLSSTGYAVDDCPFR